ncbi:hypothetical protein ACK8OE_20700, partial [Asticcacaulis sp. W401b]
YEGWTNEYDTWQPVNTVEYVLAGGTSIDVRKLNINWTTVETWNYNTIYPIALDLDGDGLNLSTVENSTVVARTDRGGLSQVAWVGPTDAFLAVDRNGDGAINRLSEISFVQDKPGATSDLEGLQTWDTNGDGLLDAKDANFSKILLWQDLNQNGRSTQKELKTLTEAGIVAIDLRGVATGYTQDLTTESFVQHTLNFIWADGTKGDAYDVALARRVLGSEGLYAGEYQAEWSSSNGDAEFGQLKNDAKSEAKASRVRQKKALIDKIGATYQETKTAAQVDFSDHDKTDAKILKRWEKLDRSEQAAWLSGQATSTDERVSKISGEQFFVSRQLKAQNATNRMETSAYEAAGASVSGGLSADGGSASLSNADFGASGNSAATGLGLSLTASEPFSEVLGYGGAVASPEAAWWRQTGQTLSAGSSSLGALIAAMETPAGGSLDPMVQQQQALLRQSMAGFGGETGGSAIWSRDSVSGTSTLAASAGVQRTAASTPALVA